MIPPSQSRPSLPRAIAVYLLLWLPSLLLVAFVTIAGCLTIVSDPMWSALSFLLALPAVLAGIWSFKASAIALTILMLWDVVTTTWPHISFTGIFGSPIDAMLLTSTVLACLVAAASPFASFLDALRFLRHR
jgi:hypothetical protein